APGSELVQLTQRADLGRGRIERDALTEEGQNVPATSELATRIARPVAALSGERKTGTSVTAIHHNRPTSSSSCLNGADPSATPDAAGTLAQTGTGLPTLPRRPEHLCRDRASLAQLLRHR